MSCHAQVVSGMHDILKVYVSVFITFIPTQVALCDEPGDVLGSGIISLGPLATSSSMTITCPLTSAQRGREGACVEVLVALEEEVTQQVCHTTSY